MKPNTLIAFDGGEEIQLQTNSIPHRYLPIIDLAPDFHLIFISFNPPIFGFHPELTIFYLAAEIRTLSCAFTYRFCLKMKV